MTPRDRPARAGLFRDEALRADPGVGLEVDDADRAHRRAAGRMFLVTVAATAAAVFALATVEIERSTSQAAVAEPAGERTWITLSRCPVAVGQRLRVSSGATSFETSVRRVVGERGLTIEVVGNNPRETVHAVEVSVERDPVPLARVILDSLALRREDACA